MKSSAIKRIDSDRRAFTALAVLLFALMTALNILTPLLVDDYSYARNFATKEAIGSIGDIFPSMAAHYFRMNGRTAPHFLAQLFVFLPKGVFNIVNAFVFCALVFAVYSSALPKGKHSCLRFAAVFCFLWLFIPVFGETCLWLTGSCNYLWGILLCLLWINVYIKTAVGDRPVNSLPRTLLFALFSFIIGGWSENTSAAVIGAAFLLLIMILRGFICDKRRPKELAGLASGWICALAGFAVMAASPAGSAAKFAGFGAIPNGLLAAASKYASLWPLVLCYAAVLLFAALSGAKAKALMPSFALFAVSLFADGIMCLASYFASRSLASPCVFLIAAIFAALPQINTAKAMTVRAAALTLLAAFTAVSGFFGCRDIVRTYKSVKADIVLIESAALRGDRECTITNHHPATKYSALLELKYIDTTDPQSWPNHAMALYYGLDTIYGSEECFMNTIN